VKSDDESRTSMSDFASPSTRRGTPSTPSLRSEVLSKEHVRSVAKSTPDSARMRTPVAVEGSVETHDVTRLARKTLAFELPSESSTVRVLMDFC
jgi:hypothetical protein